MTRPPNGATGAPGVALPAAWDPLIAARALPEDVRDRLAAAALVEGLANDAAQSDFAELWMDVALDEALLFIQAVARRVDGPAAGVLIDLSCIGARSCALCGCTENFACDGGCSWAELPDPRASLCSRCVPAAMARESPRSGPHPEAAECEA